MNLKFEIVPAAEIQIAEQAKVFNAAFAGYLVTFPEMDAAGMARFICAQGIDLCHSRFARSENGAFASFGYINRTGNFSRLAAMGTAPGARRTGAAAFLLSHLIGEAIARRDIAMVLEVFEQNAPTHSLYVRNGFREVTRLFGWRRQAQRKIDNVIELEEIPLLDATAMNTPTDFPDLPWQISRFATAKSLGMRAFRLDRTCVIISNPEVSLVRVHGFFGHDRGDWEPVRDLMRALTTKFREAEFFAPQIFPEQFGREVFQPLGFARETLNQFLMRRELSDSR